MGKSVVDPDMTRSAASKLSSRLAIVAPQDHIDILSSDPSSAWLVDAELVPLESGQPVPFSKLIGSEIVVVEVDPDDPVSMNRIDAIKDEMPSASIVVALEDSSLSLVRRLVRVGVADVVALPLSAEEILQVIISIAEVRAAHVRDEIQLAPVISVFKALGGSGATTLITHLAHQLADPEAKKPNVCILDLDLQFGRVTEVLDMSPRRSILDLVEAGGRLDADYFHSVEVRRDDGVSVVGAPSEIGPIEAVDIESLDRIVRLARQEFDYVLIEMPSSLTNWALSLLSESDRVLLMAEQSVPSLRQARRRIDLLRSLGFDMRLLSIVINRADKRLFKAIGIDDVEDALGCNVFETLREDTPYVANAQQQGLLVQQLRSKSVYAQDVARLAARLEAGLLNEKQS